jgi:hypothetical protein
MDNTLDSSIALTDIQCLKEFVKNSTCPKQFKPVISPKGLMLKWLAP